MRRSIFFLGLLVVGCSSSSSNDAPQDAASDVSTDADATTDARLDSHGSDTTPPPDDAGCPPIGSSCDGTAFVGCVTPWKGVNRVECHDGRWCAEPKDEPTTSDDGCPSAVPTAGSPCTPPSGASGYQWCGYTCASDGAVHAMICAAGIWCGDATSSCTLLTTSSDAGTDADATSDDALDATIDSSIDSSIDAAVDSSLEVSIDAAIDVDAD